MPQAIQVSVNGSTAYTTSADFCRIFSEEMSSLYLLAFLLTANAEKAEQCFVAGIGDSVEGNPVFREWARSWARRTIVLHAIRMMKPAQKTITIAETEPVRRNIEPRLRAILALDTLERFVFVMSGLEGYSDQDCSALLGCSLQTIADARARAVQQLANTAEIRDTHEEELQSGYTLVSN
ncbi:MAG TPA: sigma factor-like helix-turn-helix DNA-binding protein [Terriglobales bacterium]|jgi:hypothetical protein|nr:sigma factor-like helix-turn-helix DNA-binding protein [Terriglobales bacterium]